MRFQVTLDRIEGDMAVLLPAGPATARLGGGKLVWPRVLLPDGATEGVYLWVTAEVDLEATAAARRRVGGLLDALRAGGAGGPGKKTEGGGQG
jgi:hypothetical protein